MSLSIPEDPNVKEDDKTLKDYEEKKSEYSIKTIDINKMKNNIKEQEEINFQIKKATRKKYTEN